MFFSQNIAQIRQVDNLPYGLESPNIFKIIQSLKDKINVNVNVSLESSKYRGTNHLFHSIYATL
jgi:hypothetical protein